METGRKSQFRIGEVENVPRAPSFKRCVESHRIVDIRVETGRGPGLLKEAGRCILSNCTRS